MRQRNSFGWSWLRPVAVTWFAALVFVGACYALYPRKIDVHAEGGPIEIVQWIAWFVAALIAAIATVRAKTMRDRLSVGWLFVLAILASARELDLHEAVARGVSWLPPVHFRIDWLLDNSVPLWPKLFWMSVFALAGAALLIPPLLVKAPTMRLLRSADAPTYMLLMSFSLLGAGYVSDDIIGRGNLGIHYEVTQGMEEIFELLGAIAFALGTWYEFRAPLSTRIASIAAASSLPTIEPDTLVVQPPVVDAPRPVVASTGSL